MTQELLLLLRDAVLRQSLVDQLVVRGFVIQTEPDVERCALVIAEDDFFDGETGAFAGWHRATFGTDAARERPVVLLAAEAQLPRWLAAGARACLAKPLRLGEFLAKINTLLSDCQTHQTVRIGDFQLSAPRREIVDSIGNRLPLTEKEAAILVYLHSAGARPVPREELLESVWGYATEVSTHTVETHIYRLRQKLAQSVGGDALLATEGGGYRLTV
jgi:DNA-binding response OmpR family regulator